MARPPIDERVLELWGALMLAQIGLSIVHSPKPEPPLARPLGTKAPFRHRELFNSMRSAFGEARLAEPAE